MTPLFRNEIRSVSTSYAPATLVASTLTLSRRSRDQPPRSCESQPCGMRTTKPHSAANVALAYVRPSNVNAHAISASNAVDWSPERRRGSDCEFMTSKGPSPEPCRKMSIGCAAPRRQCLGRKSWKSAEMDESAPGAAQRITVRSPSGGTAPSGSGALQPHDIARRNATAHNMAAAPQGALLSVCRTTDILP